jgi:Flp pilus assembly protein TadD
MDWQTTLADGYQQLSVGNTEKAVSLFANKVKKHPDSAACHTALGRAYKRLGRIEEAKTEFGKAIELEPTFADGFYEYGVVQESDQHWTDAVTAFEKYLQLKPDASERRTLVDRIQFCKNHICQ